MRPNLEKFAEILEHYLQQRERSRSWFARRMNVHPSTVTRWLDGETRPQDPETVTRIAEVLGVSDYAERQVLLASTGYAYQEGAGGQVHSVTRSSVLSDYFDVPDALRAWIYSFVEYLQLTSGQHNRWESRVMDILHTFAKRVGPLGFLILVLGLGLWWLTSWLVTPILIWPLQDHQTQLLASIRFGAATLLIPLLVAAFTEMTPQVASSDRASKTKATVLFLRLAGALVGFYSFSFFIIGMSLIWFYVRASTLSESIAWILVLIPLFFSYVIARVIPANRYQMQDVEILDVDRLVLVSFALAGPFTAAFLYLGRDILQSRFFGLVLFAVVVGLLLWEYKQQKQDAASDSSSLDTVLILFWGVVVPCVVLLMPFFVAGSPFRPGFVSIEWVFFTIYVFGQGILLGTLYVRKRTTMFWPVLVWVFTMELITLLALIHNVQLGALLGAGLALLVSGLWFLGWLARTRTAQQPASGLEENSKELPFYRFIKQHLLIHESFWVMQVAFLSSLILWIGDFIPWWIGTIFFIITTVLLVRWVYPLQPTSM